MKTISIKQKVLLAALAPVIILTVIMLWIVYSGAHATAETTTDVASFTTLENNKVVAKNYIDMAVSAIKPIYDNPDLDEAQAKKQALAVLRSIEFGNNNYVFVYDYSGTNLAIRPKPELEGKNLIDLKDPSGKTIVKDMIDIAKSGGDYYQYNWFNPETGNEEPKLSYAVGLDRWGWMVGTGIYLNHVNDDIQYLRQQVFAESNKTLTIEFIAALIVVGLSAIAAVLLARYIATPIQEMAEMMSKVAHGDLTPRMKIKTTDELGTFAQKFDEFLDKIHSILTSVSTSANQLAESASDLNIISKETYDAISEQDRETISIASAVDQMSGSASEIASNGDTVKEAANDAGGKTAEGSRAVNDNLASVKQLAVEISDAATAVSAVEKRTDEIQSMLAVIHSVTEQTNLLALNAAIEAARAGEQGRGFAVVADEVRSLAMRSAESAEEIRKIIEGLIADTQSAVNTMNHSRERSEENLERTTIVAESLSSIDQAIQSILEKSAYIANATEEQNRTAQEIAENTNRIKNISTTSAERMSKTRESSQKLDVLSKDLLQGINFFKLS